MTSRVKIFSFLAISLLGSFIGYRIHLYFTHQLPPQFELSGISKSGYCKDNVTCFIKANNSYKIAELDVTLDGKPFNLKGSKKVGLSRFEIPFILGTKELSNGRHTIGIRATDASYRGNQNFKEWSFVVDNEPLKAAFLKSEHKVDQGHTLHIRVNTNKGVKSTKVTFLGKNYQCFPEAEHSTVYECFIPIDCEEAPSENVVEACVIDNVGNKVELSASAEITPYAFKKALGFAVDKERLAEEERVSISGKVLEDAMEKWAASSPKHKLWSGAFEMPITVKRVTTPFGEIRTTAEKGRYLHKALDLVNLPRSVVWASQNGKVIIKDQYNLFGNTVVIDHGHGVQTLYCHLDDFAPGLEVGDMVKKGNPIGRIGKTGYASGYHLHWELRVNNTPVNPAQWTERNF